MGSSLNSRLYCRARQLDLGHAAANIVPKGEEACGRPACWLRRDTHRAKVDRVAAIKKCGFVEQVWRKCLGEFDRR